MDHHPIIQAAATMIKTMTLLCTEKSMMRLIMLVTPAAGGSGGGGAAWGCGGELRRLRLRRPGGCRRPGGAT